MELYRRQPNSSPRWITFENPNGTKNGGGRDNLGAKGHAYESVAAGEEKLLFHHDGSGIVNRIWVTVTDRSPEMLRSLVLRCWWDGSTKPAVECPLGDFFAAGLGHATAMESELFYNPEGRSFNCFIPMPYRSAARITLTNESPTTLTHLFYEISVSFQPVEPDALYFHCWFNRENPTTLRQDYKILPRVQGAGRYLGATFGVIANPLYAGSWFGEGEVKGYLDGDTWPTLVGTGTEDYLGTGWGQGVFSGRYHGCLLNDQDSGKIVFYRLHITDPICFESDAAITIQQIGGAAFSQYEEMERRSAEMLPVTADCCGKQLNLYETKTDIHDLPGKDIGWVNYYRRDDFSSAVYFYLDKPESNLPLIIGREERIKGL
jgi:hypothetical protein